MNPKHIHTPISTRARCPVCHEAVYSRGGIHPQCAVRQSEPPKVKNKGRVAISLAEPVTGATEQAGADAVVDPPMTDILPVPGRIPI
jgi:hypothetical protein